MSVTNRRRGYMQSEIESAIRSRLVDAQVAENYTNVEAKRRQNAFSLRVRRNPNAEADTSYHFNSSRPYLVYAHHNRAGSWGERTTT